jgi:predicted pyridoxine 5'-phosphate oxidase superfamily flavin-nucleotide-binding protein
MGRSYERIDPQLAAWIAAQPVFFVGTAPLAAGGHVNVSPKGGSALRVLDPHTVAYLDGAGSGIETVAHLRENGRIVVMLCAFDGAPRILRLHGRGEVIAAGHAEFDALVGGFPRRPSVRAVIRVHVTRIADSCGYGVPLMSFERERSDTASYVAKASDESIRGYLQRENRRSIDGLGGLGETEVAGVRINRDG